MIEVEKKFALTPAIEKQIAAKAHFIKEEAFTDAYYDTADYKLTTQDKWLRQRNGHWELKIPAYQVKNYNLDQYQELEDEVEIKSALCIATKESLATHLKQAGYQIFCSCTTHRRKYRWEQFTIDIDSAQLGGLQYNLGEIELMINAVGQVKKATKQIEEFAAKHSLDLLASPFGKVETYIQSQRPAHFKALVVAGVLKP